MSAWNWTTDAADAPPSPVGVPELEPLPELEAPPDPEPEPELPPLDPEPDSPLAPSRRLDPSGTDPSGLPVPGLVSEPQAHKSVAAAATGPSQ
jgi:hypothetical protein